MNQVKKNVALLALCQAMANTSLTVLFTVAALIGSTLANDKAMATLPIALLQLSVMAATIPASLLMRRQGRRFGFVVGTLIGMMGVGLATTAVFVQSFPLFCLGTILLGVFNGFVGFYRFAAAEVASEAFRAQAISLVVAGGVVAALLGPGLATWGKDWFTAHTFAGSLLVIVGLQFLNLLALIGVEIPPMTIADPNRGGRSLFQIMRQPMFCVAVLGSMVGYGVMAMVMTATPLAMVAVPHPFHHAATVIQWHVLGMFAPSFFTGFLIARFGVLTIVLCGVVLNFLCIAVNVTGTSFPHFLVALALLGVGWNFMFVGSTTLLTEAYTPEEKAKTQAAHDFLMLAFVAFAAFLSGQLLERFGWAGVNYAALPALAIALFGVLWLQQRRRRVTVEVSG
jgi:MFS family permease